MLFRSAVGQLLETPAWALMGTRRRTHAHVGWVAELETYHHDAGGTATILDDCTIQVTNFTYDGSGLVVYFTGGRDGDYAGGFEMGDDLLGTTFSGETVNLTLPSTRTLDDLDGLSVWCITAGVSFADGEFAAR